MNICRKNQRILCGNIECKICFERSFAKYDGLTKKNNLKIHCWNIELNNNITPYNVSFSNRNKYWFKCDTCLHNFEIAIGHITKQNQWCSYCGHRKLCDDLNCNFCFLNSFASYQERTQNNKLKIECWSKDNLLSPRQVMKSSGKIYKFDCDNCPHSFEKGLNHIIDDDWCPYCSHHKLCHDDNCIDCFENSFASFEGKTINGKLKVDCWSNKNDVTPREVFKNTHKKYKFDCDICSNIFEQQLNCVNKNVWCTICKNKTEKKLLNWLKENFKYKIKHQAQFKWCKNLDTNRYLPFDFCIEELKLILEPDGRQHFEQVMNWESPNKRLEIDEYKIRQALINGYTIIRILQNDIYNDKNEWDIKLKNVIKQYNKPTQICIGDEIMYEKYNNIIKNIDSEELEN